MSEPEKQPAAHATSDVGAMRIGRVYAEALLDAAAKKNETEQVLAELDILVDQIFQTNPQIEILFSSAAVGRIVRRDVLNKALADRTSETFFNFLHILNNHERLDMIRPIRQAAHEIDDERKSRVQVHVQSAVALPDDVREQLLQRIRVNFQKEPVLQARIAPELLGGLKIRVGDLQVDATVSNYLDNMKKFFLARSSHEIQSRRDSFSSANGN